MAKKPSSKKKSDKKPEAKAQSPQPDTCEWDGCQAPAGAGQFYCGTHLARVMGVGGGEGHTHGR